VEIEHELLAMNKNSVEYDYLTEVVSNNIKQLKMAINGQG
jgi:flagellar basal-body rod protein FlgB